MVVDTDEYVGPDAEKEPIDIINAESLDNEAEQLQDLPLANDCKILPSPHHSGTPASQHLAPG